MSPTFGHRYPAHVASRREATQRLQWHPRDSSEGSKDRRPSPHSATSFSPSPTLPFTPQTYHPSTQSYSSAWTSGDTNVISSPTLHTMSSQAGMSYDIPYHSVSRPLSSPEEFTDVEEFGDA
ncbi:hypothetical protein BDQ12DRAFT_691122 [Crucibulum laeve]|uniref:Uncharacterized protein n=1 Tax=Crucibulum laeve TaxID=68775 RepID=A0A5C3LJT6_9AGAR|nr:hypothetical protein BDQ12DRAFT_691122 [Crucibulum laeve]